MGRGAQSTGTALFGQIAALAFGLISSIFSARWLGPAIRGDYAIVISITALAGTVAGFGVWAGLANRVAKREWSVRTAERVVGYLAPIGAVVGVGAAAIVDAAVSGSPDARVLYWASVLLVVSFVISQQQVTVASAAGRVQYAVVNTVGSIVLQVAFFAGLYWGDRPPSVATAVAFTALAQSIGTAVGWALLHLDSRELAKPVAVQDMRWLLGFGIRAWPGMLLATMNARLDIALMALWVDKASIGFYSLAVATVGLMNVWPAALSQGLSRAFGGEAEHAERAARRGILVSFWGAIVMGVVLMALGGPLIRVMYGEAFVPAYGMLLVLVPGLVAYSGATISGLYASTALDRPWHASAFSLVLVLVDVGLLLALAPRYGAMGAAVASAAGYVAAAVVNSRMLRRAGFVPEGRLLLPRSEDFVWARGLVREARSVAKRASTHDNG